MIKLTNKTTTTIIIVVLLSLPVLRPWVSPLFSKKYDIENEISEMCSSIKNFLRQNLGGFVFKKSLLFNYHKTHINESNHQNREAVY